MLLRCVYIFSLLAFVCGCGESNLGSPDNPEKFTRETLNQFDAQIEKVKSNAELSDKEKAAEIKRIESERADFEQYNGQDGQEQQQ